MTVYIGHEAFSGPFDTIDPVMDRGGVYAILSAPGRTQTVHCLDQSANVRTALKLRMKTGEFASMTDLSIAVRYTPGVQATGRKRLVEDIIEKINID